MDPKLTQPIANFTLRFSNELENNKTTICSPLSVEIVLAMLALGCKNQSHDELMQALGISNDKIIRLTFRLISSNLKSLQALTLNMANRIYLKKGEDLKLKFKKDVEDIFDSSIEQLDFGDQKASADVINEWVADRTNNVIKDIVSADTFDKQTCMVLINAIYYKGNWAIPFKKDDTKDREFYVDKNTVIKVPQMYQDRVYLNYGVRAKLNAKLLEMYYEGFQSSMVIVLPDEVDGLSSMLRLLAAGHDLMADIKALKKKKVDVTIPKFKVEMTIHLKDLLLKLGIESIFDKNSLDFDILTSSTKLFVSEAIQKAFIDVNEAGTEAGAATRPVLQYCCSSKNPQFVADHPFLYLLFARGVPIFVGTYHGLQ